MANTAVKKVQQYQENLKQKAEDLILKGFPAKIIELNQLLDTPQFCQKDTAKVHEDINIPVPSPVTFNNSHQEPSAKRARLDDDLENNVGGTKVLALMTGVAPSNKTLSELIQTVKPHIRQLVEDSNLLKMWISFLIPKIEDGNNFGVSVQEETLSEIQSVESESASFFDQISRYYSTRAKIISKVAKYPHIEDYRKAVRELDEREYLNLWLVMCEIRNRYGTLYDLVIKNIEKLKKPRSMNSESLY